MHIGSAVAASTTRYDPTSGTWITHLASLTCRSFLGITLRPLTSMLEMTEFGADVHQTRKVSADWPVGNTEDFPVKPGDQLTLPTATYNVSQVKVYTGQHLVLYVQVPTP